MAAAPLAILEAADPLPVLPPLVPVAPAVGVEPVAVAAAVAAAPSHTIDLSELDATAVALNTGVFVSVRYEVNWGAVRM